LDGALLAAKALAVGADDVALHGKLGRLADIEVLEGHRQLVNHALGLALAAAAASAPAAKEHVKNVRRVAAAAAAAALLQRSLATLVVNGLFLFVRQDRVGKLFFSKWVVFCFEERGEKRKKGK
jgi:hypothetical protein